MGGEIETRQGPGAMDRDRLRGCFLVVHFFFFPAHIAQVDYCLAHGYNREKKMVAAIPESDLG